MTLSLGIGLGLMVAVLMSISMATDKVLLQSSIDNNGTAIISSAVSSLIVSIPFLLVFDFSVPDFSVILVIIAIGFLTVIPTILYFYGVKKSNMTQVSPITSGSQVVVVLLALVLLGESLNITTYFGLFLLIIGVLALSGDDLRGEFELDATIIIVLMATLLYGAKAIAIKQGLIMSEVGTILVLGNLASTVIASPYLLNRDVRKELVQLIFDDEKGDVGTYAINEVSSSLANVTKVAAYSLGPVSIISPITSVWGVFVFGLVLVLTKMGYDTDEDFSEEAIIWKIVGTLLIVMGLVIIVL